MSGGNLKAGIVSWNMALVSLGEFNTVGVSCYKIRYSCFKLLLYYIRMW